MKIFIFIILLKFILASNEVKEQIYYEIPESEVSHCIIRINQTSVIGCSSSKKGNVGVVVLAYNLTDLKHKLTNLNQNSIFVVNSTLFTNKEFNKMFVNEFIVGLLVMEEQLDLNNIQPFSEDYKRPNSKYSYILNNNFNKFGLNYAFKKWPYPVALIKKNNSIIQENIFDCYNKFNLNSKSDLRCCLEMRSFMAGFQKANISLRKDMLNQRFSYSFNPFSFSNNMSGFNFMVYGKSNVTVRGSDSVIVLLARMDSLSMFEKSGVNVNGELTSVALLLSVMKLLMKQPLFKTGDELKKDVLFLFLDNESYDYLGSNTFINNIKDGDIGWSRSLNMENIGLLMEFGELGFTDYSDMSFFYPSNFSKANHSNDMKNILKELSMSFNKSGFQNIQSYSQYGLPPSSLQYLLRTRLIPSVVIGDYRETFKNPHYNSYLDITRRNNNTDELLSIVNAVAGFVYKETTGLELNEEMLKSDEASPDKIIECYSENIQCNLLKQMSTQHLLNQFKQFGMPIPAQDHSGSKSLPSNFKFGTIIQDLIVYLSGTEANMTQCVACGNCGRYYTIKSVNNSEGTCYSIRIGRSDIVLTKDLENEPLWLTSGVVGDQSIRLFVVANNQSLLAVSIIITLLAALLMVAIKPKLSLLFTQLNYD